MTSTRVSIALFGTIFGTYLLCSPAHFLTTPDEELNLRTTLSLVQGYGGAVPPLGGFATKTGLNGREYAQYGLGLPLAAAPWCLLGLGIDPSNLPSANRLELFFNPERESRSAGTEFLRWWMTVFSMAVTALTVVIGHRIFLQTGLAPDKAVAMALLLALGTYAFPHGRTLFTEPLAVFCLVAAVALLLSIRNSGRSGFPWRYLAAGAFWGYAVLIRLDSLVTLPAAAWFLFVHEDARRWRLRIQPLRALFFFIPWAAVLGSVLFYNFYRFGSWVSTGYEDQAEKIRFLTPLLVGLHGFLFTPGRSLFLYSPPLLFAVPGIQALWKQDRWLAGGLLLLIAGYLGMMSKWQNWAGGYDWGPRHIYQITPFLMIFAAVWFKDRGLWDSPAKRVGGALFVILALFVQFLGLSADPVLVVKRMLYAWPAVEIGSGLSLHSMIMQFMVYLPQFSNPVLHWQWILDHGPDLLILQIAESTPLWLVFYLIPISMAGGGGCMLYRYVKRHGE
ncbi:MAG: hypothetical protein ACE15F_22860 [bacterium]